MKDQSLKEIRELKIHIGAKILYSVIIIPLFLFFVYLAYLNLRGNAPIYELLFYILFILWTFKILHCLWTWNIRFDLQNNRIIIKKGFGKKIINTDNVKTWTLEKGFSWYWYAGGFFICNLKTNQTISYPIVDESLLGRTSELTFKPLFEKALESSKYVPSLRTSGFIKEIFWYLWV